MKTNNTNNIEFFHDKAENPGKHVIISIRRKDTQEPVILGLDHSGYDGKAIVYPGHNKDVVNAAIAYLKKHFSNLKWEIC